MSGPPGDARRQGWPAGLPTVDQELGKREGHRDSPRTALINHVWMTRLDDELYSGLDDGLTDGADGVVGGADAVEQDLEVAGLGSAEPGEDLEGLP
jgi:hypothetical protein